MDEAIVEVFGEKYTDDPAYDLENDPQYDIAKLVPGFDKKKDDLLLKETGIDFTMAGAATRNMVILALKQP